MPEPLTANGGLTRIAVLGRSPSSCPMRSTRLASVADSSSIITSAATARRSSASVLPGPAKLIRDPGVPVSRATCISPADATSSASTRPARCCTTAGIGLAFTA